MPPIRIIPRLDIKGPNVIKGIHLEGLRIVGTPGHMARNYYAAGADEIVLMDVVASLYGRNSLLRTVEAAAREIFVPMTVGGGIRTLEDIVAALCSGADKVAINTAATRRPDFLREAAHAFGSQCIVLSVEAKERAAGQWEALTDNGRERTEGTYSKYSGIDDKTDPFYFWTTLIKFGIGRATYDTCQEIRNHHIDREEAVALVHRYDEEFPRKFFPEFLEYLNLEEAEFFEIVDSFRSPHLWEKTNDGWTLRHKVA